MAFAVTRPTINAADEPGAGGGGDRGQIGEAEPGLGQGCGDQPIETKHVGTGGDLGHHAAIGGMLGELRDDGSRQDPTVIGDERRGRLVAARLDAEDDAAGNRWKGHRDDDNPRIHAAP